MKRFLLAAVASLALCSTASAQVTQAQADAAKTAAQTEISSAESEFTSAAASLPATNFYLRGARNFIRYNQAVAIPVPPYVSTPPIDIGDAQYATGNYAMAVLNYNVARRNAQYARRWLNVANSFP